MYITPEIYEELTGRDVSEASEVRIRRASRLLDSRIGMYERDDWKLDLDELTDYQKEAVQMWVSYVVVSFAMNNDSIQVNESIKLGRFSVSARQGGDSATVIPDQLRYADIQLKDSGLIKRNIPIQRRIVRDGYYI